MGDAMVRLTVRIPAERMKRLKVYAAATGQTIQAVVLAALDRQLAKARTT